MTVRAKTPDTAAPPPRTAPREAPRGRHQVPEKNAFSALVRQTLGGRRPPCPLPRPSRPTAGAGTPKTTARSETDPAPEGGAADPRARRSALDADAERDAADERAPAFDPLDPSTRQLAQLGHPAPAPAAAPAPDPAGVAGAPPAVPPSLEHLMPGVVRRIAWGGDKRKASVRMELGGGLDGAVVLVHAEEGKLQVEVDGPAGEVDQFRERITDRLRRRGLDVSEVR